MTTRHETFDDCPYEWREADPNSYGPEYRVFRCGCPQPDIHLLQVCDPMVAKYEGLDDERN